MKIFRWILGIVAPYIVAIGIIVTLSELQTRGTLNFTYSSSNMYFAFLAFKEFVVFFLIVFLTCVVIPAPKKYAAVMSVILNIVIVIGIIVVVPSQTTDRSSIPSTSVLLVDFASTLIGLVAGAAFAYAIFRNKGWDNLKPCVGSLPAEQY